MAIPPQFLAHIKAEQAKKGATKSTGPTVTDGTKDNSKLPAFLQKKGAVKKGSASQLPAKGTNPFAAVTKGKAKSAPGVNPFKKSGGGDTAADPFNGLAAAQKGKSQASKNAAIAKARKAYAAAKYGAADTDVTPAKKG